MTQPDYPQQPYQQSYFAQSYPQPRNGLGTAGMVLGIIGLAIGWIPILGWVALILALVGLPLSAVGRGRAKRGEATNRGQATAGIVCNIITLALSLIAIIAIASMAPMY